MNNWNTGYPEIEKFADGDLSELFAAFEKKYGIEPKLVNLTIHEPDTESSMREDSYSYTYDDDVYSDDRVYEVDAEIDIDGTRVTFLMEYIWSADENDWFVSNYEVEDLYQNYNHAYMVSKGSVSASIAIMAADEDDPFADMNFEDDASSEADVPLDEEDSVEDSLEDMASTLDDINDSLEEIDEDQVDIETENNIEDHYIAECEMCHGVFITSVIESDQAIEKISGTCPLCDEECDQYIKWVIKEL